MKKFFSLLNVLVFLLVNTSPGLTVTHDDEAPSSGNASEFDPNHLPHLTAKVKGKPDRVFFEYSLSDQGFSSAFCIFDLERNDAIRLLRENLSDRTIKKFVSNSIRHESFERFQEIFSCYKDTSRIGGFSHDQENQIIYLNYFEKDTSQVKVETNHDQEGAPLRGKTTAYGLLDALAHIQKKSFYIYRPVNETNCLRCHGFYPKVRKEHIDAICRGGQFNLLASIDDEEAQKKALKLTVLYSALKEIKREEAEDTGHEMTDSPPVPEEPNREEPSVQGSEATHALERPPLSSREEKILEEVRSVIPDRTFPYRVKKSDETFYEYYTSGDRNSCGFRIFDLERKEAIVLLQDHIMDEVVQKI